MLLNKRFPQIIQGNITYNTVSPYFEIFDFNTETPYWYIEVGDIYSLTDLVLDTVIPNSVLHLLQTGKVRLIIVNAFEGVHNIILAIYENLVIKRKVLEQNILVFSESFSIKQTILDCATHYNLKPIESFLPLVAEYTTALYWKNNTTNIIVNQKKFICLNRRWRPHRPTLVGLLCAKGILDDGYVSLISTERENWDKTFDWIVSLNDSNPLVTSLLEGSRNEITNLSNLTVDLDELEDYGKIWGFRDYTLPFYEATYFSVVTETYFYEQDNGICITEKVFRSMCYKHPFIILARPKFLETIRSLGYQTFHGIIDESYDTEEDNATRLLMVANEIEKLCKMPLDELQFKMKKCRSICEHNYNVLLSSLNRPKRKEGN